MKEVLEGPKRIGKYQLEECLGGGMSRVFRAQDTVMGRTVALKILPAAAASDAEARERFLREAKIAGELTHENIITVYDFGEDNGQPFMVMEFLRGEDLRSAIKNSRTGDLSARLGIALQIAKALEYIHRKHMIHRDIKPENVYLLAGGAVKLMDFGIAKTEETNLTRPGAAVGTPFYMAPEQVSGRDISHLVDVYAFGILLFELLTGTRPIHGDTLEQIFSAILHQPYDLAPLRAAGVPKRICDLIGRCVAKKPSERPRDFQVVRCEIESTLAARPAARGEETAFPAGWWRLPAIVAFSVLVLCVTYFAVQSRNNKAVTPERPAALKKILSTPTGAMVLVAAAGLPPFYIDVTEVTNEAYGRFCGATQRPPPHAFPKDRPDYPVVNITIIDAFAFAKWAGKRLPNKTEWEEAARGPDGRAYPWGNKQDPSFANVKDNPMLKDHKLAPVDSFKQGASPYGVLQMAGNAWEFVDKRIIPSPDEFRIFAVFKRPYTADEPWYIRCGGAYDRALVSKVTSEWSAVPSWYWAPDLGFRCAKDPTGRF